MWTQTNGSLKSEACRLHSAEFLVRSKSSHHCPPIPQPPPPKGSTGDIALHRRTVKQAQRWVSVHQGLPLIIQEPPLTFLQESTTSGKGS